jgi:hypothetical protein
MHQFCLCWSEVSEASLCSQQNDLSRKWQIVSLFNRYLPHSRSKRDKETLQMPVYDSSLQRDTRHADSRMNDDYESAWKNSYMLYAISCHRSGYHLGIYRYRY